MKKKTIFVAILTVCFFGLNGFASQGANFLKESSQAFTQIADLAMPATVFIKVQLSNGSASDDSHPFDMYGGDEFFRRFFGSPPHRPNPEPQIGGGSGFFISSDGYIVTNNHVVRDASQITVVLNDEREFTATIKGSDPKTDLALLKIEGKDFPYLSFGDSDDLKVGEWVVAIGNPFGLEATLTVGVVSAKGRQDVGLSFYEDFIQTDAAINPGNSGGPLLNLQGKVIGVNTAIFSRSGGYMGIGLAIPSKMAEHVISQLQSNGNVQRTYLGVILQPVDKALSDALNLEKQEGILISEVVKDSPAEKAGLQSGDIILQYNKKPVKNVSKFRNDIGMMKPGDKIQLLVLRNNKQMTITATLDKQNDGEAVSAELIQKMGLSLENLSPDMAAKLGYASEMQGVVITKVKPGSPAANAGLRPGFIITGVALSMNSQKKVQNTSDLEEALKSVEDRKHVIFVVRHQNHQRYYTVKIK